MWNYSSLPSHLITHRSSKCQTKPTLILQSNTQGADTAPRICYELVNYSIRVFDPPSFIILSWHVISCKWYSLSRLLFPGKNCPWISDMPYSARGPHYEAPSKCTPRKAYIYRALMQALLYYNYWILKRSYEIWGLLI